MLGDGLPGGGGVGAWLWCKPWCKPIPARTELVYLARVRVRGVRVRGRGRGRGRGRVGVGFGFRLGQGVKWPPPRTAWTWRRVGGDARDAAEGGGERHGGEGEDLARGGGRARGGARDMVRVRLGQVGPLGWGQGGVRLDWGGEVDRLLPDGRSPSSGSPGRCHPEAVPRGAVAGLWHAIGPPPPPPPPPPPRPHCRPAPALAPAPASPSAVSGPAFGTRPARPMITRWA